MTSRSRSPLVFHARGRANPAFQFGPFERAHPPIASSQGPRSEGHEIVKKVEITELTALRALAAWWVVLFHTGYMLQPLSTTLFRFARTGYLGVDVFFVLSGFVIAYNYMDSAMRNGWARWREFFWMRFARLYPVHIFTLLVSLFLFLFVRTVSLNTVKDFSGWTPKTFLANVFMVHAWVPHLHDSWNYASWSISSEWFAYLLFPLIVYAGIRRIPPRTGLVVATLVVTVPGFIQWVYKPVPFFALLDVLFEFAAGCMIYQSFKTLKDRSSVRYVCGAVVSVGAVCWVALHIFNSPFGERWTVSIFPLLILYLATSKGIVHRIMCSRFLVYWGGVSYSLYMTHNLTLWLLKYLIPGRNNMADTARFGIYLVAIAAVAAFTFHFVEEPARKWLRYVISSSKPPQPRPTIGS